jgi:predicted metallopeptidase
MEEGISDTEDTREEMDLLDKANVKSKNLLTQNIQKIWGTMKSPNLKIIVENSQLKPQKIYLIKMIKENFLNLKKDTHINIQKA